MLGRSEFTVVLHSANIATKSTTINSLIDDWNSTYDDKLKMVQEHNASIEQDFNAGKLSAAEVCEMFEQPPKRLTYPSSSWCRWWRSRWGWALLSRSSDDQLWLPYSHCDMEMARSKIQGLITTHQVHPCLVLNYDQLWRNAFSLGNTPLCYKGRAGAGQRVPKTSGGARMDKKIHSVKGARRSITVP